MWLTPKMILVATFGTFVAIGGDLTAPVAFSFMSLFGYVQFYLQFLPNSLSIVIETANAIRRIQNYLLAEEINLSCINHSRY
jgi:ATP-binding cassette subfamily C (CFTR/MRP) protein 1